MEIHFSGLLGQERIVRHLTLAVINNRLAHAYLLVGPTGSGRGHLALHLFAALNCENRRQQPAPCWQCQSCLRAGKQQHENLIILAPPPQIKVGDVREALRSTAFAPLNGGVRLIFIREAEHLNPESANTLLKTLEEPPDNNLIILSVQDTAGLLPTLVSRCRRLNLQPLAPDIMLKALRKMGCNQPEARVALSSGSLGQAMLLDPEHLRERLDELLTQLSQTSSLSDHWALAEDIGKQFLGKNSKWDRQGLTGLLELLGQHYRDHAVSVAGRPDMALLPDISSHSISLAQAVDNFNQVRVCQNQLLGNVQPVLALAVLLNQLGKTAQGC